MPPLVRRQLRARQAVGDRQPQPLPAAECGQRLQDDLLLGIGLLGQDVVGDLGGLMRQEVRQLLGHLGQAAEIRLALHLLVAVVGGNHRDPPLDGPLVARVDRRRQAAGLRRVLGFLAGNLGRIELRRLFDAGVEDRAAGVPLGQRHRQRRQVGQLDGLFEQRRMLAWPRNGPAERRIGPQLELLPAVAAGDRGAGADSQPFADGGHHVDRLPRFGLHADAADQPLGKLLLELRIGDSLVSLQHLERTERVGRSDRPHDRVLVLPPILASRRQGRGDVGRFQTAELLVRQIGRQVGEETEQQGRLGRLPRGGEQ